MRPRAVMLLLSRYLCILKRRANRARLSFPALRQKVTNNVTCALVKFELMEDLLLLDRYLGPHNIDRLFGSENWQNNWGCGLDRQSVQRFLWKPPEINKRGDFDRYGGSSLLIMKCSRCTLFNVFKVQIFVNFGCLPTDKVVRYKNRPDLQ
jgi:hypothetical protein